MPKDTEKSGGEKEGPESQGFTITDRRGQAKDEPPQKPKEAPKETIRKSGLKMHWAGNGWTGARYGRPRSCRDTSS